MIAVVPLRIKMPNGQIIHSTHTCLLKIKDPPKEVRKAHIFPGLHKCILLSIGVFYDNGCLAIFDSNIVLIINKTTKKIIMIGHQDPPTKLDILSLENNIMTKQENPDTLFINSIYES